VATTSNKDKETIMTLFSVVDFLTSKVCDERRKYGNCNCRGRNGNNPCAVTMEAVANAENGTKLDDVLKRVSIHKCANATTCNHKGCARTQEIEIALLNIIQRKAAA
jgi:hypothetical protein